MRFDWTDLRIVLHVCEAGSMTAAAARSHLTLAAVSARIRGLEDANGIVLFQREARGVRPTLAGRLLADHARRVFDQVQQLERDLLLAPGEGARPLVLLANSSSLARPLADAFGGPEIEEDARPLVVRETSSEATVQALRSGAADVGIVSDAVDTHGLVSRELGPDPLVLVVARGHVLAGLDAVRFRDALSHPWVAWGEHGALSAHLQLHALALGARIEPRVTYPALDGVLRLVAVGRGITVLPQALLARRTGTEDLRCVPLDERWARRCLRVCHVTGNKDVRAKLAQRIVDCWSL